MAVVLLGLLVGCGGDRSSSSDAAASTAAAQPARTAPAAPAALPPRLRCAADSANCASVRGRIVYVEAVDPDGDGDVHFALASGEGITLPGITVVDVGIHLRPAALPEPGDYLSAVGPVYPGSRGQLQIEATAIRVARRD